MADHGPVQEKYRAMLNALATGIDDVLNPEGQPKTTGFTLLLFDFGNCDKSRMNYISNGNRQDVTASLREILARFEGQYHEPQKDTKQ